MSENKEEKTDAGSANENTGFDVLDDAQAIDADETSGALDDLGADTEKKTGEAPVESEGILENEEETEVKQAPKAEKAHEKKARLAAEMNTKGYGR